jgi:hypothetical protein
VLIVLQCNYWSSEISLTEMQFNVLKQANISPSLQLVTLEVWLEKSTISLTLPSLAGTGAEVGKKIYSVSEY